MPCSSVCLLFTTSSWKKGTTYWLFIVMPLVSSLCLPHSRGSVFFVESTNEQEKERMHKWNFQVYAFLHSILTFKVQKPYPTMPRQLRYSTLEPVSCSNHADQRWLLLHYWLKQPSIRVQLQNPLLLGKGEQMSKWVLSISSKKGRWKFIERGMQPGLLDSISVEPMILGASWHRPQFILL